MAVEIKFAADVTEVRKALDQVAADARARAVTIPVGVSGGGGVASAIAGVGGGIPTAGGVFGQSAGVFGGGLFQTAGQFGVLTGAAGPFGGMAPMAAPGFAGFGGGAAPITGAVFGPAGGLPAAGGGGRGPGGYSVYGFGSRGLYSSLATGMIASGIGRAMEAERDYSIAQTLGGMDQAAQVAATMRYREQLIGAFPFVGRAVGYMQDPSGMGEAGITATMRSAEAREAQTLGLARGGEFATRLTEARAMTQPGTPHQSRLRELQVEHDRRMRDIEEEARKESEENRKVIAARRVELDADRAARVTRIARERTAALGYENLEIDPSIQRQVEGEVRAADAAIISGMTADAAANTARRRAGNVETLGGIGANRRIEVATRAATAWLTTFGARTAHTISSFLDDWDDVVETGMRTGINRAQLNRDPRGARRQSLELQRRRRLQELGFFATPVERGAVNADIDTQLRLLGIQEGDEDLLRNQALSGQGAALRSALGFRGRLSGLAGQSTAVTQQALLERQRLLLDDPVNNRGAANQVLQNAQMQQQLLVRDFLGGFHSTRFSPRDIDPTLQSGSSEIVRLLNVIARNTSDLYAAR